jgi:hypothetical protein
MVRILLGGGAVSEENPTKRSDRKLGDEWKDWDGRSAAAESSAGKRLFFSLSGAWLLVLLCIGLFVWYLIVPRLAQWHSAAPAVVLVVWLTAFAVQFLAIGLVALTLLAHLPMPPWLSALMRRLLAHLEGGAFRLGTLLSLDRDRIAHSFVLVHNALVRINGHRVEAERILILLPRCLGKEQLKAANRLAADFGVRVGVVAGGELARQRIREHEPRAVIGVACERDLLSGIRDVRGRLCVLGIPNTRPHGPCKDTRIDLDELRRAVEFYLNPSARSDSLADSPRQAA